MMIIKRIFFHLILLLTIFFPVYSQEKCVVDVVTDPPGARFRLDNYKYEQGPTPSRLINIPTGKTYNITFYKDGYEDKTISWTCDCKTLTVTLEKEDPAKIGKVTIDTKAANAFVLINGEYMGDTPLTIDLKLGNYNLSINSLGYENYETDLTVNKQNMSINAQLKKEDQKISVPYIKKITDQIDKMIKQQIIKKAITSKAVLCYQNDTVLKVELSDYNLSINYYFLNSNLIQITYNSYAAYPSSYDSPLGDCPTNSESINCTVYLENDDIFHSLYTRTYEHWPGGEDTSGYRDKETGFVMPVTDIYEGTVPKNIYNDMRKRLTEVIFGTRFSSELTR